MLQVDADAPKDRAQEAFRALEKTVRIGLYQHYKGGFYVVYGMSLDEATLEALVHYYSLKKKSRWTRTYANFSEEVGGIARFTYVGDYVCDEVAWHEIVGWRLPSSG